MSITTKPGWDWKTNDSTKTCNICGDNVEHGNGWLTVGLCELHSRIWNEDIKIGLSKQNRLRDIMVARGETTKVSISEVEQR